jgi:diadenosine tetraphosphate (Ap4A) HIT family hydrolase
VHIIVSPKQAVSSAWEDIDLSGATFKLASQVCKIMAELELSPWFNIQANGNWGLLPGNTPFFHVHIYGRNKTASWGKPIALPEAPGTFHNDPMPEAHRTKLIDAFKTSLDR